MATRADLPNETLVEIFSRLPPKSIGKLRSLSKPWRKSLSSPQFIKSHLSRQKSQQENLILAPLQSRIRVVETINDDDGTVSRELDFPACIGRHPVITCDGLILSRNRGMNIFLANPITLELVKIPNPPFEGVFPHESSIYGLGHDSVNDDYKVVLVSYYYSGYHDDDPSLNVDVYSVKTGVWKRIESLPKRFAWPSSGYGPSVNGAMHWLGGVYDRYRFIAALDIANEVCSEIPAPSDVDVESSHLGVLGGCLCLIKYTRNSTGVDVWIMKEYGVADSWTKFTVSDPVSVTPLCFIRDEEEVLLVKGVRLVVHNVKEGTWRNLVVDGVLGKFGTGWAFVGSLVSPTALCGHNGEQGEDYCAT